MLKNADWISPKKSDFGDIAPVYRREFSLTKPVEKAVIYITAMGVYDLKINGKNAGDYVLAPGWTFYSVLHQYQNYDITALLQKENTLEVTVAKGWYGGRINRNNSTVLGNLCGVIARIHIEYQDGTTEDISTDGSWRASKSEVRFCDMYDGISYDATVEREFDGVNVMGYMSKTALCPQYGEIIKEHERFKPEKIFVTPAGETVIDFGQNLAGYVEFSVDAKNGDEIEISHAEVLDKDGNFYTENYRSAQAKIRYICRDGEQSFKPTLTFFGFRYIRLDKFPGEVRPENFTAIAVYSDMKRTGYIETENPLLNKLYSNVLWGQKSNFLDIPTDCPQRDERNGWTGDAQVFIKCASYNYDVKKFFEKWLKDLRLQQSASGAVPNIVPYVWGDSSDTSAGWGDAAVICPWQLYLMYGDKKVLEDSFESMKKWIDYITSVTEDENLWTGGDHFGDWLGIDAPAGSYSGASDKDLIASAYYAYSTSIVIKAGKVLGEDMAEYEALYKNIKEAFCEKYNNFNTQTECVLALHFDLTKDKAGTAEKLAKLVEENGCRLTTGFLGTPYLLYALSDNGYTDLAYSLLLQEAYPSWLYTVKMGATTMWEHWDGINDRGEMWSSDMNSYNHYAYGAVADWIYSVAAGIKPDETAVGFEKVVIEPKPDKRLGWLKTRLETKHGTVKVQWRYEGEKVVYNIETPVPATIIIDGKMYNKESGVYTF